MCDFSEKLIAWLDHELPEEESNDVQKHVRRCKECRSQIETYRRVSKAFDACCDTAMASRVGGKATTRWVRVVCGAAAAAAAVIALFLAFPRGRVEKPSAVHAPVTEIVEAHVSEAPPSLPKKAIQRHVAAPVRTKTAEWLPNEPTVEIAIPAEAMFPPGAVPDGVNFIVDVRIGADGSAQQLNLWQ